MNTKQLNALIKALKSVDNKGKTKTTSKVSSGIEGLAWWEKKFGFDLKQKDLKVKCSNGKSYPAVKGITKDGTELTLVAIRGGNVYAKPF